MSLSIPIPRTLPLVVTDAGRAKAVSAAAQGLALKITHIAVGAGSVVPTAASTALSMEQVREEILAYAKVDDFTLDCATVLVSETTFLATEVGIYSDDTLVAAGTRADGLVDVTPGIPYTFSGLLVLTDLPAGTTVEIDATLTLELAFLAPIIAYGRAILALQRQVLDLEVRLRRAEGKATAGIARFAL